MKKRESRLLRKDRRKTKVGKLQDTFLCPKCRLYRFNKRVQKGEEWTNHLRMHQQHIIKGDEREWVWSQT